jgi:hypothetical protein
MPALRPRRLIENKPATSAITSLRDDEVTERCHGYQNYFFSLSLFQLKDEPEGDGNRQLRKAPFGFENWLEIISRRAEGMWESRSDFQGLWEGVGKQFYRFPMLSTNRHFLRPLARACKLVKEFALGLLHAPCSFGITAGGGHVLERVQSKTGSEVLSRLG